MKEYSAAFQPGVKVEILQVSKALSAALCVEDFGATEQIGNLYLYGPNWDWHNQDAAYPALYVVVGLMAQGKTKEAHALADKAASQLDVRNWPYPIVSYLDAEITDEQLVRIAKDSTGEDFTGKLTEVKTLVGLSKIYSGRSLDARDDIIWVVEHGRQNYLEYDIANSQYEKLFRGSPEPVISPK